MSDYVGVVTTIGQAKIAAAIGGTALNLTTIRVGDGNGAPITPIPGMTDLVRRVGAGYAIISSGRDPVNANHWRVTALIPVADGPFDIREIGVFDGTGDMIAVARHVLVEKRSPAQGAAVELLTDIVLPVSETAQVTVQVQPASMISIAQMLRAGFCVVESATLTAPPGAPALGRTHVVPAGATGAWAGLAGYMVQWNGIVWVAVDVPIGFHVVDNSKGIDTGARWLERTAAGWKPGVSRLIQRQPGNWAGAAGGTAAAMTVTLDPAPTDWDQLIGVPIRFLTTVAAAAALTFAPVGLAAKPMIWPDGIAIPAGGWGVGAALECFYDGAKVQVVAGAMPPLALSRGIATFSVAGAATFTATYTGLHRVTGWAGGAGGGYSLTGTSAAGGGGPGGACVKYFFLIKGVTYNLIIGPGGLPGLTSGVAPTSGGTTSFDGVALASGGSPGVSVGANQAGGGGTAGTGLGTGVCINAQGSHGSQGYNVANLGGAGGDAPLGGGYGGRLTQQTGTAGSEPGGGGAGAINGNGGPGAPGGLRIEW